MLKRIVWGFTALVVGLAVGAGSLWYATFRMAPPEVVANGPWRTNPAAGSASASPYTKLYIAVTSILALNRSETIYFEARKDSGGEPLTSACEYALKGPAPDARWWSVTAYGPDDMLIPNPDGRYSAGSAGMSAGDDVEIALTPDGSGPRGIATGNAGAVTLLLRLYQPAEAIRAAPEAVKLFEIERGACRG